MKKETESKEFELLVKKAHQYKFGAKGWSDWGLLFRFIIVICRLLDKEQPKPEVLVTKRKPRKISAWNTFSAKHMKEGKNMQEISELYKLLKK